MISYRNSPFLIFISSIILILACLQVTTSQPLSNELDKVDEYFLQKPLTSTTTETNHYEKYFGSDEIGRENSEADQLLLLFVKLFEAYKKYEQETQSATLNTNQRLNIGKRANFWRKRANFWR